MIIGITGNARAGKGEAAKSHGFLEFSFAAPMRAFVIDILGLKGGLQELDNIKETPHPLLGGKTPRKFLQVLGTEFGREMIWEPIWVESCMAKAKAVQHACISDCRFDNEAEAIKNAGGIIIHIHRPNVTIAENSHKSESGISSDLIDFFVINDSDVVEFHKKISAIANQVLG